MKTDDELMRFYRDGRQYELTDAERERLHNLPAFLAEMDAVPAIGTATAPAAEVSAEPKDAATFSNYTAKVVKKRLCFFAKSIQDIRTDLLTRTGDWPRQVGSTLFVFQADKSDGKQRYLTFTRPPALFAWIREKLTPQWKSGNGGAQDSIGVNFVTHEQLYQSLHANSRHYEGISRAPHWPERKDQFYDYGGALPPPSDRHRVFWQLIDFFCLADETYRLLAAAFFIAPAYYRTNATGTAGEMPQPLPRPLWLVDTVDAQRSGKSTLVKMDALLYGAAPLDVTMNQLTRNADEVLKRILSVPGRQKRIFLIDNITATIKDGTLASWVTSATLSGRAAYGHGDETRANDFTFAITVNGAEIDSDTATRAYTIKVRKRDEEYHSATGLTWEADVARFIAENRRQIFADILDMLDHAVPRQSDSRFPDFDATVLSAVCSTDEEFAACRARIEADATGANVDVELADEFTEAVENYLEALRKDYAVAEFDPNLPTLLTHATLKKILDQATGRLHEQSTKQIRTLLKSGLAERFSKKNPRLNRNDGHGGKYPEGIIYGVHLIGNATETAFQIVDLVPGNGGVMRSDVQRSTGTVKAATMRS